MKSIAWNLCLAAFAMGPLALAALAQSSLTPPAKPMPAAGAEQALHLCKLGDIKDVDLKGDGDKTIGEIDGMILDAATGRVRYAMIAKGGVLEIGEKQHLVPWESIRVTPKETGKDKDEGV